MINKVINGELTNELNTATDDDLIIVARSYKNRKDDAVQPVEIKNGIFFYVAYDLPGKLAFLGKATPEQINKAKGNMAARAVIGTGLDIMFGNVTPFTEWKYDGQPMNVATLETKMNGAGLLYCEEFLREIKGKMGDFYILPSAIHELIFVSKDFGNKENLTEMVRKINAAEVSDSDYLADRAFEVEEWI